MKIISTEIYPVNLKLKEPYTISYETVSSAPNVFLRIETNTGITAFGCGSPDIGVTGETIDSTIKVYDEILQPFLKGIDPLRYALHMSRLKELIPQYPSVMAMVDSSLYDLLGKKADLPVYKLLGAYRTRMKTSITVGICPLKETVSQVNEFIKKGFKIIKVKGGKDVDEDIAKILKIREKFGINIEIRFDANQGYSVYETLKFVEKTKKARVELIEQPTSKGEPEAMGQLIDHVPIPVMADESIMDLRDAFKIAKKNLADMINIKLMKVGGINEAMQINSVAKSAGLESMVGCMDESALGISAGLHFALSRPNVIYADLDGHLDLVDDPADGAVILKEGVLYPTELPGLGFNPKL
jgi:L-alanine-DL-glutamate epimerase-like enolase superfamily enzyme